MFKNVCVIGGGGYVGSRLIPQLLRAGHDVTVLDLWWYGQSHFIPCSSLRLITGDIRDRSALRHAFKNQDAVIHLACISNDPSFELNPKLGKEINLDSFPGVIDELRESQVKRFIYASSSSVYGIKEQKDVTEETECNPITDYSLFKLCCEDMLKRANLPLDWVIARPATLCGYAPRLRLDLVVNILTIHAIVNKHIMVNGGRQLRPNLNIKDMAQAYLALLDAPAEKVNRETFNIGFENLSLLDIAKLVQSTLGRKIGIEVKPSSDERSYHVNSDKIFRAIGFKPKYGLVEAINSIATAYHEDKIEKPMSNPMYYNIKRMQELDVQ